MTSRKIVTILIEPPIPVTHCDWLAFYDGEKEDVGNYGYGETEEAAVADLKSKTEDELPEWANNGWHDGRQPENIERFIP